MAGQEGLEPSSALRRTSAFQAAMNTRFTSDPLNGGDGRNRTCLAWALDLQSSPSP